MYVFAYILIAVNIGLSVYVLVTLTFTRLGGYYTSAKALKLINEFSTLERSAMLETVKSLDVWWYRGALGISPYNSPQAVYTHAYRYIIRAHTMAHGGMELGIQLKRLANRSAHAKQWIAIQDKMVDYDKLVLKRAGIDVDEMINIIIR